MDTISLFVPNLAASVFYMLLVLSTTIGVVYYYIMTSRITRMGNLLPGPPTVPFFGNAFIVLGVPPSEMIDKLKTFNHYGPVVRTFLGPKLFTVLIDPRDIAIILSSYVHIDKSAEYRYFKPWLGEGLLISTGHKWRTHRKIIAPTFHLNILKTFVPVFYENSVSLVERLRREVGREFDCHDYLSRVTVDILMETAMGIPRSRKDKTGLEYAIAVMRMCDIIHRRQYNMHLRLDVLFQFTKSAKLQKKFLKTIHGLTNRVIRERKTEFAARSSTGLGLSPGEKKAEDAKTLIAEALEPIENAAPWEDQRIETKYVRDDLDEIDENDVGDVGEKKRLAFLDQMLEMSRNGANLTDEEIKEEVDTIMFEGHDTTAAGSSFVLCLLGVHQDIQATVYRELQEIFKGSDRPVTFQDTLEMKYLERVILETLRLFPPVPLIARKLTEDVKLYTHDYVLPRDSTVLLPIYQVHRDPEIYQDPEKFDPDNFLPERTQHRHYYAFIPFSAGPRSCVGRKYAMLKLKVLLSTVLRNYKIRSDISEQDFRLQADIILKRADGFKIRVEPRTTAE